jgi:hypothetical protein
MAYQSTVSQLLTRIAANVNGEATAPSSGSTEETHWINLLDSSQDDWSGADDWPALRKSFMSTVAQSGTSIGLPTDFVKLDGYPSVGGSNYEEIRPEEVTLYLGESYCYPEGNQSEGFWLTVPPQVSGTSVSIPYFSRPTSLATTTTISPCPDHNFLVAQTSMKILRARGDPKFTLFQQEADLLLVRMLDSRLRTYDQFDSRIPHEAERTYGFRAGVDG